MGTVSADDFESGHRARRRRRHHVHHRLLHPEPRRVAARRACKAWQRARTKAVADYTFHMAITGWGDKTAEEMRAVVQRARHHVVQGVHGLQGRDHGRRRRALSGDEARRRSSARSSPCTPRTATRCATCRRSWSRAATSARVPPGVAAEQRRGRGDRARADDGAAPRRHRVHRPHDLPRGGRGAGARQARGPALLRRDLPAVPAARRLGVRQARLRGLRRSS